MKQFPFEAQPSITARFNKFDALVQALHLNQFFTPTLIQLDRKKWETKRITTLLLCRVRIPLGHRANSHTFHFKRKSYILCKHQRLIESRMDLWLSKQAKKQSINTIAWVINHRRFESSNTTHNNIHEQIRSEHTTPCAYSINACPIKM